MKYFLAFTVFLLTTFSSLSQEDTTTVPAQPKLDSIFKGIETISVQELDVRYLAGCAHGHICCYAGCSCCPELGRAQIYDTIAKVITNGVKRVVVSERYGVAREHGLQRTHIRFKRDGKWSEEFYPIGASSAQLFSEHIVTEPKQKVKELEPYEKDQILVMNHELEYMVIDLEGNEVPMTYNVTTPFSSELFVGSIIINNYVVCALLKPDGTAISRTKYNAIQPFNEDGLALVQSSTGTGLINASGKEVIPAKYYSVNRIGKNRYCVAVNSGPTEIFDEQGNQLTKMEYNHISNYSDGLAFARKQNEESCYLDMNGKMVLKLKYDWGYDFSDGLAAVVKNEKWGFIDKTGKLVIPCQYYRVHKFVNGVAAIATGEMNNEMWMLIDKTGKQVNSKLYSEIMEFKSGLAQCRINGVGYGFIDTKGNEVMECKYTDFGYGTPDHWDVDGMFVRSTIQGRKVLENSLEVVDLQGKQLASLNAYFTYRILPKNGNPEFGAYPFILVYKNDNKCNIVDFKGNTIFKSDYDNIMIYNEQLAVGVKSGNYFVLNPTNGEIISNFGSKQINNIQYGIVTVITDINSYVYDFYDLKGKKLN